MKKVTLKIIFLMILIAGFTANGQVWSNGSITPITPTGLDQVQVSIDLISDTNSTYDIGRSGIFYCVGAGCNPLSGISGMRTSQTVLPSSTDGTGTYTGIIPPTYGVVRWIARKVGSTPSGAITDSPIQEYTTPLQGNIKVEIVTPSTLEGNTATDGGTLTFRFENRDAVMTTINYSVSGTADTTVGADILTNLSGAITTDATGIAILDILINGDTDVESNETITLTLVPDASYTIDLSNPTATGTITDDDARYVYRNDTLGWINDPSGADGGRPSTLTDNVTIREGTVNISSFTCRNLVLRQNTILNNTGDVNVSRLITLGNSATIIGNGYIAHGNANDNANAVLRTDTNAITATVNNYRGTSEDRRILWISRTMGQGILQITGEIDLNGQDIETNTSVLNKVVFKSTATQTAQIIGAGTFTPSPMNGIEVERFISGNRAFRFLSSSVSGSSIFDSWQESGLEPIGFGTHVTGVVGTSQQVGETDMATGLDITTSGSSSLFGFGNSWNNFTNTKTTIHDHGKGYRVFVRGDRNVNLSSNSSGQGSTTTLRAKGSLEQDDISIPLVTGFNLIGNPYQSKVNMDNVTMSTATNFIYYWDPTSGTRGAYTTVTIPGGMGTLGNASNIIEPGQAFFVEATAPGTAQFEITDKVTQADATIFNAPQLNNSIRLTLFDTNRYATAQTAQDGLVIEFNPNENIAIDKRDAIKFNNIDENLSIIHDATGSQLAIERRTLPSTNDIISLNVSNYKVTDYTFEATVNGLPGMNIFLKDNYKGTVTQLNPGTSTFNFTVDLNNPNTLSSDRFDITFQNITLGVDDDLSLDQVVSVFPNPVNGDQITIYLGDQVNENVQLSLFNSLGQSVLDRNLNIISGKVVLGDLSALSKGLYLLNIKSGDRMVTRKVIIE